MRHTYVWLIPKCILVPPIDGVLSSYTHCCHHVVIHFYHFNYKPLKRPSSVQFLFVACFGNDNLSLGFGTWLLPIVVFFGASHFLIFLVCWFFRLVLILSGYSLHIMPTDDDGTRRLETRWGPQWLSTPTRSLSFPAQDTLRHFRRMRKTPQWAGLCEYMICARFHVSAACGIIDVVPMLNPHAALSYVPPSRVCFTTIAALYSPALLFEGLESEILYFQLVDSCVGLRYNWMSNISPLPSTRFYPRRRMFSSKCLRRLYTARTFVCVRFPRKV